jgi:hypothetical protein
MSHVTQLNPRSPRKQRNCPLLNTHAASAECHRRLTCDDQTYSTVLTGHARMLFDLYIDMNLRCRLTCLRHSLSRAYGIVWQTGNFKEKVALQMDWYSGAESYCAKRDCRKDNSNPGVINERVGGGTPIRVTRLGCNCMTPSRPYGATSRYLRARGPT